jgi:hypothetical protein
MITGLVAGVQILIGTLELAHKLSYPMGIEGSFPGGKVVKM